MKLEYNLINGKEQTGLDESLYLFVGPKISELGDTIEGDSNQGMSFYTGYGSLNIPNNITTISDYAFAYCSGFTGSLTIGNSVTTIGVSAFFECSGFTEVNIPNSVTTIGTNAFSGCTGLTSITIPNSVTEIGDRAFFGCTDLTSITCLRTTPPTLGLETFSNTNGCTIYVPAESVDTYKSASGWTNYVSRIQPITT